MIETIRDEGEIIAIIVHREHELDPDMIEFISPLHFSLQLGLMNRSAGYRVIPHAHNPVERNTIGTQEVLFITKGSIEVDFYSFRRQYLESRTLRAGDVILLSGAGHGITMLENSSIIEVKNGPFVEGMDKERFDGVKP
jgi:hypothetical protein